jgi:hypothetical protein
LSLAYVFAIKEGIIQQEKTKTALIKMKKYKDGAILKNESTTILSY